MSIKETKKLSGTIAKLLKEKEVTTAKLTITVDKIFKEKCDYICNATGIKVEDYLSELLVKSEVNRVYKALLKDKDMIVNTKKSDEDINDNTNAGEDNEL